MKKQLALLLFLGLLGCAGAPKHSVDASKSHRELVHELFEVANLENTVQGAMQSVLQAQLQADPSMKPYEDVFSNFYSQYMGWGTLKPELTKFYVEAFTKQEVIEIIRFYKTPTGQKIIVKEPELMQKGMELGQRIAFENMGELYKELEKRQVELSQQPTEKKQ